MPDKSLFDGAMLQQEGIFARLRAGLAAALEPSSGAGFAVPGDAPVHFEMVREQNVLEGLTNEIAFALTELRRDPSGFAKAAFTADITDPQQRRTRRAAMALTVAVPMFAGAAFLGGIFLYKLWTIEQQVAAAVLPDDSKLVDFSAAADIPKDAPKMDKRAGGGGGGGKQEATPASKGKPPTPSLTPPVLPPTTKPTPRPPSLAMMPTVQVDPRLLPPNPDPNSLGDPKGVEGPPSDGPGTGNGIGSGSGGGVGSGHGTGVGPGEGFNMGGGPPGIGGRDRDEASNRAATPVQILSFPRPNFTEAARQNKTQGSVLVKVLFGADGRIKSAKVVKGLPDGLNEMAIQAVYKFNFVPAKNATGRPVDQWKTVNVAFTLR